MTETDVLIIGSGMAGCSTALELVKKGIEVTILSASDEARGSGSFLAGSGIAYQGENDSPELFAEDVLRMGQGLSLPRAVEQLVEMGPECIDEILIKELQINFEHTPEGDLTFAEGDSHSRARTIYFQDHTGKAIMDALLRRLSEFPNVTFLTGHSAVDLITLSHHSKRAIDTYKKPTCVGAYVLNHAEGKVDKIFAKETILATGGAGEVFLHTTNPREARGDGLAMAYRAGVRVMNLEYMQFHPLSLYLPNQRRMLLTDTLRGEGAELLSQSGEPFMENYHEAGSLAPREVVARAIYVEMLKSGADHVWLDITGRDAELVKNRFPNVYDYCLTKGFDMTKEPLPIVPAAHYQCGGVWVDRVGRTTMERLRAVGEVSCTGVHGAARLVSASLLESLVWGVSCGRDIAKQINKFAYYFPAVEEWQMCEDEVDPSLVHQDWLTIKQTMWNYVGLVRDDRRLRRAQRMLRELRWEVESFYGSARLSPELIGLRNGALVAHLVTEAAIRNKGSAGCHYRQPNVTEVTVREREMALT